MSALRQSANDRAPVGTGRGAPSAARSLAPAPSPVRGFDVAWLLGLNVVVIAALWWTHGGPGRLSDAAGWLTGIGQLTALYGTLAVLGDLVLIGRVPWVERRYGMDRLNLWHRWAGFLAVSLLVVHAVSTTVGYAGTAATSIWSQIIDFVTNYPNLLAAVVALVVLMVLAATSIRAARRVLRYETWWFIHLYAYLAVILAFAHQFAVGTDFVSDWWARVYWSLLYAATAAAVLGYRWILPVARAVRHRLRVAAIEPEAPGVVTISLSGRHLGGLRAEAGQFFLLRFLTRERWWKAMPLSLSSPPDARRLRFTVKATGDDTTALQRIPVGTRVMAEGPYGAFTAARASQRRILLVAGGIGITPLRALFEDLDRGPGDVALIYRTRRKKDAVFLDDLVRIAGERNFDFFTSYSRAEADAARRHPFDPAVLRRNVPDVAERDVFVCGPAAMVSAARAGLLQAGVPPRRIHVEKFAY